MIQRRKSETASHHISINAGQRNHRSLADRVEAHTKRQLPARVPHQVPAPNRDARLGRPVPVRVVVDLVVLVVALVDSERIRLIHICGAYAAMSPSASQATVSSGGRLPHGYRVDRDVHHDHG